MMAQFIAEFAEKYNDAEYCFLWMSIGKGELHRQSYASLAQNLPRNLEVRELEKEFFGTRASIERNEVVVGNWEKLRAKDKKTGEWKNALMKDSEKVNFRELLQTTRDLGVKVVLIIDEIHAGGSSEKSLEIRDDIVQPFLTVEVSATPAIKGQEKVEVEPQSVIDEGMIKKEIVINEHLDAIADDETETQEIVMQAAFAKRQRLQSKFAERGVNINPLVLIQLPDKEAGEDKKNFAEKWLAQKEVTTENGKLAIWLTNEKVNQEKEWLTRHDGDVEFLIFKQAIDTGWDCPRAHILVRFRQTKSVTFEIQTLGRILRMPEAKHYGDDDLDRAFVYTNLKSFATDTGTHSPNMIKSKKSKRKELYGDLTLRSYYRNRVDFGDITMTFYEVLGRTFCENFGIEYRKNISVNGYDENIEKVQNKGFSLGGMATDKLLLNEKISASRIDVPQKFQVDGGGLVVVQSADEMEQELCHLITENLNGYAPKRSMPTVKNALRIWFRDHLGIGMNQIIRQDNILLNNYGKFGQLLDQAVKNYKPTQDQEINKKIAEIEEWNDNWEISQRRNYSDKCETKEYQKCLYEPFYFQKDSSLEEAFIEDFLEKATEILWWWKNGSEHMALNFGIKYTDHGSTFQPDFIVRFIDGRIGIFDTKGTGFQEDENKVKAEALQQYIQEENHKGLNLWGGLVIKDGVHWRINQKSEYKSFREEQSDWEYFDLTRT